MRVGGFSFFKTFCDFENLRHAADSPVAPNLAGRDTAAIHNKEDTRTPLAFGSYQFMRIDMQDRDQQP